MTYSIFSFHISASWMLNAAIWRRNIAQMNKYSPQKFKQYNFQHSEDQNAVCICECRS